MTTLDQAYAECRRITKENAKNFYYAFIALPPEKRSAIYATYSFCRMCDDAADDPGLSHRERLDRLSRIRESLDAIPPTNDGHPIFIALSDTIDKYRIPKRHFEEVIQGVEMDLVRTRFQTFEELREYCYHVASVVGLICVEIYEYAEPRVRDYATDLGLAMQLTNIIRDVREDLERDRIYLPLEEMHRFGYTEEDLKGHVINDAFLALMAFQAERARRYFRSGLQLLPYLTTRSRTSPALLATLYQRILDKIESGGFKVFDGRVGLGSTEKYVLTIWTWLKSLLATKATKPRS